MATLVPVDHDPFEKAADAPTLIPVDHDPFASLPHDDPHAGMSHTAPARTDKPGTTWGGVAGSATRGVAPYAAGAATGALAGSAVGGVGAIPGAALGAGAVGLTQLATGLYDRLADKLGWPKAATPQEMTDKVLDYAGVQRPTTGFERVVEQTASGAAGALTGAGLASRVAGTASNPVTRQVATKLAENPAAQAIAGGAGGAGAQAAAEAGGGPMAQAIAGMAASLAPSAAGRVVAGAVAPRVSSEVQELLDAGVDLTPGQMTHGKAVGIPRRMEETAKSVPVAGAFVRQAEGHALDTFNLATANKALEPVGITLPKGVTGRAIIEQGQAALTAAYDAVLPRLSFAMDSTFTADMRALNRGIRELPAPLQEQFQTILDNRLHARLTPGVTLNGDQLKQVQSELSAFASRYRSAPDPAQRDMAYLFDEANEAIRDAVERQNPNYADTLRQIDSAYAMFVRVENAAARRAGGDGRFTPADLLGAIKGADRSVRKRAFSRGDALLQDWAETANQVIANRLPDSGTTERAMGIGGAAVLAQNHPLLAAGLASTVLPYTGPGMRLTRLLATPGASRTAVGNALRTPVSLLPGAISGTNPFPPSPAAPYVTGQQ